ncbi:GNAT family N-acetyltransferase [Luminiphilus sp.]|nr:GNAT family N-acetyltransferase [Luminiphilus sp.]
MITLSSCGAVTAGTKVIGHCHAITYRNSDDAGPDPEIPEAIIARYGPAVTYLLRVEVEPEHRGRGYMRQIIDQLADFGLPIVGYVLPLTDPDPTPGEIFALRAAYSRLGFVPAEAGMMVKSATNSGQKPFEEVAQGVF